MYILWRNITQKHFTQLQKKKMRLMGVTNCVEQDNKAAHVYICMSCSVKAKII